MSFQKSVYDYVNFRDFLRDAYLDLKNKDKKFSFRYFSKQAGFKSSSVLKDVIEGRRGIAPHSIDRFVQAFKLGKEEGRFFRTLVLFGQAETSEEKQRYAEELFKFRGYKKIHPLKESQYNFYARWYLSVIRELVNLKDFQEDPQWIAKKISPPITPQEAKKGLEELIELGLLLRDESGHLKQTDSHITTPDEVTMSSVAQYHKDMMKRAVESIDRVPREKRELSAITLGMSLETAKTVKEMIQNFRKSVVEFVAKDNKTNAVYQINLHLVPLTEVTDEEKDS
jgi:uncharacterized protein (TIGR02147 family)